MKIPKSISELATWHRNARYVLAAVLIACAVVVWIASTEKIPDNFLWLSWLTVLSLVVVALTPICKEESVKLHISAAIFAGLLTTVLTAVLCPLAIGVWWIYVFYTLLTDGEYKVLIAELCCLGEIVSLLG